MLGQIYVKKFEKKYSGCILVSKGNYFQSKEGLKSISMKILFQHDKTTSKRRYRYKFESNSNDLLANSNWKQQSIKWRYSNSYDGKNYVWYSIKKRKECYCFWHILCIRCIWHIWKGMWYQQLIIDSIREKRLHQEPHLSHVTSVHLRNLWQCRMWTKILPFNQKKTRMNLVMMKRVVKMAIQKVIVSWDDLIVQQKKGQLRDKRKRNSK